MSFFPLINKFPNRLCYMGTKNNLERMTAQTKLFSLFCTTYYSKEGDLGNLSIHTEKRNLYNALGVHFAFE